MTSAYSPNSKLLSQLVDDGIVTRIYQPEARDDIRDIVNKVCMVAQLAISL